MQAAKKKRVGNSVKKTSQTTYKATQTSVVRTLGALRGSKTRPTVLIVKKHELLQVLSCLQDQKAGNAKSIVAALKKHATAEGKKITFLADSDVTASAKGVKRSAKAFTTPCGTLTLEQIEFEQNGTP